MRAILNWNANTEADLAGYKVYRSIDNSPLSKIAVLGLITTYDDDLAAISVTDYVGYALTAYDTAGNESEPCPIVVKAVDVNPPIAPVGLSVVLQ